MAEEDQIEEEEDEDFDLEDRSKDHSKSKKVKEQLADIYDQVVKGFDDKADQNLAIERGWDVYNCVLNENQAYNGTSEIYVPIVRDAVEARVTRFSNQIFPQNGRYSDVVGTADSIPWDIIALLDNYVIDAKLRSVVVPALMREGDISGQYSLHLTWSEQKRHIVKKIQKPNTVAENGAAPPEEDKHDDREFEEVKEGKPSVEVIDARNLVILPASVDEIEEANIVAIAMWVTKEWVKDRIDDKTFDKDEAETLIENFSQNATGGSVTQPDTEKKAVNQAGVKMDASGKKTTRALIYKVWSTVKLKDEKRRCEMYFAGRDCVLSCKRNPHWSDRVPVISKPAIKVPGSIWGKSRVSAVEKLQYQANDAVNLGMDSAQYALLPIVMTDPAKNPKIGSMILAMAAIWETSPQDTKFAEFPKLYTDALGIVAACKEQIFQSLSVNPAMIPQGNSGKKPSQSQVAQEQQVALETTADTVSTLEEGVLNEVLRWFYEFDYQYRDKVITIQKYGQMGLQATLEQVPLLQDNSHYIFRWNGTEANKAVQQVQQMIAAMNVLRGIPPQQLGGRKLDLTPILDHMVSVAYGPRMGAKVLIDQQHQMIMEPGMENELMLNGFPVHINPQDNDILHIQEHMKIKDNPLANPHITEHLLQMRAKNLQSQGMGPDGKPQGGAQGVPGGAGPGVAGTPRPGAVPGIPRPQQPPGAIHKDQMPLAMPRR